MDKFISSLAKPVYLLIAIWKKNTTCFIFIPEAGALSKTGDLFTS